MSSESLSINVTVTNNFAILEIIYSLIHNTPKLL